jgi:hypothetical protein
VSISDVDPSTEPVLPRRSPAAGSRPDNAGDTGSTLPVVLACSAAEATPLAVLTPGKAASLANGKARASTTSAVTGPRLPTTPRPSFVDGTGVPRGRRLFDTSSRPGGAAVVKRGGR